MISWLSGVVREKAGDSVVLNVSGVGYEVYLTAAEAGSAKVGEPAEFYIYEQVREDAYNLYGFGDVGARVLFVQLLGVSGIGPKVAMNVLSSATRERLEQAILAGDPDLLGGIAGVGKKTAERIVVELKGKVAALAGGGAAVSSGDSVYQALIGLGYSAAQAAEAVAAVPVDVTDEQERIKLALKGLSK